ncbi:MAG: class III signal peptide [Thermoproteaceae archaeon]|nr:class III signal peptide [Thermoproteaceae archaeon]
MRGLTSMEIAIIVGIILVIAVAVGWWLYTTAGAAMTGQPRLNVVTAEVTADDKMLTLVMVNPGPVDAQIAAVELAGVSQTPSCTVGKQTSNIIKVGANATCTATFSGLTPAPGTSLSGRVILAGGQSFPFTAIVKPGSTQTEQQG